jgi:hypothetical protein
VTVPAQLEPGLYKVQFETRQGEAQTGFSGQADYRVIGEGQSYPTIISLLEERLGAMVNAGTQAVVNEHARALLQVLRELPQDQVLTPQDVSQAATQLADILASQSGPLGGEPLPSLEEVLNLSKIDARYLPPAPVFTPEGQDVGLDLGNGVQVRFATVAAPGETQVAVLPGPDAFAPAVRGEPHVAYDLTTTANFGRAAGIQVAIDYREGDFADESQLRVYHREGGGWVDRTVALDTQANQIVAEVGSLSSFVLAMGEPSAPASTIYLPVVVR